MDGALIMQIKERLAPAGEFVDDDIARITRQKIPWRGAVECDASEIREVGHIPRAAVDADKEVASSHEEKSRSQVDGIDQRTDPESEAAADVIDGFLLRRAPADENEIELAVPVNLPDQCDPFVVAP